MANVKAVVISRKSRAVRLLVVLRTEERLVIGRAGARHDLVMLGRYPTSMLPNGLT